MAAIAATASGDQDHVNHEQHLYAASRNVAKRIFDGFTFHKDELRVINWRCEYLI